MLRNLGNHSVCCLGTTLSFESETLDTQRSMPSSSFLLLSPPSLLFQKGPHRTMPTISKATHGTGTATQLAAVSYTSFETPLGVVFFRGTWRCLEQPVARSLPQWISKEEGALSPPLLLRREGDETIMNAGQRLRSLRRKEPLPYWWHTDGLLLLWT